MVKNFSVKVGHVTVIAFIINSLTEIDEKGKIVKGVDKASARITSDISDILGLSDGKQVPVQSMGDLYELHGEFASLHIKWIKEKVNDLFEASMMPLHFAKYALDIVDNWE